MRVNKNIIEKRREKAKTSVELVREYFKRRGYHTTTGNNTDAKGHDIVIIKDNKCFRIEVKTASKSTRSWRVGKTFKRENDFIAIVFPDKTIHFDEWSSHINKCDIRGFRHVTNLAKLFS